MSNQGAIYTNNPTNIAVNRILFDRKTIENSLKELDIEGIYFHYDKNNVDTHYKKLIIGPADTPYEGGFYFFKGQYPDNYPFYPMTMKTMTQGGGVRKHPNLYVCGKCCFSFLGTWQGPPWTAVQNCKTVAFSIRSVLTENPIENEPGWENKKDERTSKYAQLITYFNIRHAVIDMFNNPPDGFSVFKPIIERQFLNHYSKYLDIIEKLSKKLQNNQTIASPVYGFSIKIDYDFVRNELKKIHDSIDKSKYVNNSNDSQPKISDKNVEESKKEQIQTESQINNIVNDISNIQLESQTDLELVENDMDTESTMSNLKKKIPNKLAKDLPLDFEYKSENDGQIYKVIEVKMKNGMSYKKWSKKK
jgi:ubiquitin-conjugating enzyme E2 Z